MQFISTPLLEENVLILLGKIVTQLHSDIPVLIALLNDEEKGLYVDSF